MREPAINIERPWPTPSATQRLQRHMADAKSVGVEIMTDMDGRLADFIGELERLSELDALPSGVRQGYGRIANKAMSELLTIRQIQGRQQ